MNDIPQLPLFTIAHDGDLQELPQIVPITNKQIRDLTGQVFGRLTVLGYIGTLPKWKTAWLCACECGNHKVIRGTDLTTGKISSCRCLQRETIGGFARTHGRSKTREHRIWQAMITRCENPNQPHYGRYGGRGISVCDEWRHSFEQFLADMGPCPSDKYSIDRINNDLGYSPDNCRWATATEQANNKSANHFIEFGGERRTIAEWARETGINSRTLRNRIQSGWSAEEILTGCVG